MKSAASILKGLIPPAWITKLREQLVALSVTHVCGPRRIKVSRNGAIVTCVVRNGEFYIESFIRHYQAMGFRHVVFLDNGSSDSTVTLARKFQNVSVWRSTLPIEANQRLFKRYLAKRFGTGGWCLDADIDEFFDFPGSDEIELGQFLEYLNGNRFTTVVTQLVDMFSSRPLSELEAHGLGTLQEEYPYYDLSNVEREPYSEADITRRVGDKNVVANEATRLLWGGIRKTLWGNRCLLTKHSLFFQDKGMELFSHVHFHNNARVADVSCAMLHYKLAGDIRATAEQNRVGFSGNGKGYRDCLEFIRNNPNYQVKQATAVRLFKVGELVESGFLMASLSYGGYVKERSAGNKLRALLQDSGGSMPQTKRTSTQVNPGIMKSLLMGVAVSCICQAATVVTLGVGGPLASQVRVAALFYGLEVQDVESRQLEDRTVLRALASMDTVAAVVSGDALSRLKPGAVRLALRRAGGESVPMLLVESGSERTNLAEWTHNAVSKCGLRRERVEAWGLRIGDGGMTWPLANVELPFRGSVACRLALSPGAASHVLMETRAQADAFPVLVDTGLGGQRMFVAAGLALSSTSPARGQTRRAEQFAEIAPIMMFLRYAAGERAWHAPAQYANLTVDDPWLREPYGNLDYADLALQMKRHHFHTTVAFIPWNFDRSEPAVAAMFRANPASFSIAIHGNNHNHREFDSYATVPLDVQIASLKQALARMELFSKSTGVAYDPVMVFPHAVSPAETFVGLKTLNYWATTNSENVPLGSAEPDDPLFPLRPETLTFNNFLSIKRVSAEGPVSTTNLAIDAFLGNPLLLYVHQGYFAPGAGAFNSLADTINRIVPNTQWSSLGHIVQHLYLQRLRPDLDYDVLAFSSNLTLDNLSEHDAVFHVKKAENFRPAIRSLLVDGRVHRYQSISDAISFVVTVPARQQSHIELTYGVELDLAQVDVSKTSLMTGILRLLSDFRDNVLSRNSAGRTAIGLYSRAGTTSLFAVLLTALLVAIGRRTWKRRKQKKIDRDAMGTTPRGVCGRVARPHGAGTPS